jgi:hypothetical protein
MRMSLLAIEKCHRRYNEKKRIKTGEDAEHPIYFSHT